MKMAMNPVTPDTTDISMAMSDQSLHTAKAVFHGSREFARTLRQVPLLSPLALKFSERIETITEAAGPPEQVGSLLVWNFESSDGSRSTLSAKFVADEDATIFLAATDGLSAEFWYWLSMRLAEIASCERPPVFSGAGRIAILTVEL